VPAIELIAVAPALALVEKFRLLVNGWPAGIRLGELIHYGDGGLINLLRGNPDMPAALLESIYVLRSHNGPPKRYFEQRVRILAFEPCSTLATEWIKGILPQMPRAQLNKTAGFRCAHINLLPLVF
jgi:hypothetical protein